MTAQPSLFPAGQIWIVRVPMSGKAYWFTDAREATRFFNSNHPVTSNSIFPAVTPEEADNRVR